MPATPNQIKNALLQLDSGNNEHWTDDGLPVIDVVRELANDPKLTRRDIEKAAPNFARAGTEADVETEEADTALPGDPNEPEVEAAAPAADEDETDEMLLGDGDLRKAMKKRIDDSHSRLIAANEGVKEAHAYMKKCEGWHAKAISDFNRRFPPMTPNQALKEHLAKHQDYKSKRGLNPIDASFMNRQRQKPNALRPTDTRGSVSA